MPVHFRNNILDIYLLWIEAHLLAVLCCVLVSTLDSASNGHGTY
jgi:hypothetical protein